MTHRHVEHGVIDAVQLQREEKEMGTGVGNLLLDIAIELRTDRIARVACMQQPGIGNDATEQLLELLEGDHRLGQKRPGVLRYRHLAELALVAALEGDRVDVGSGEIGFHLCRVHAGVKVFEPPLGQVAIVGRRSRESGFCGAERQGSIVGSHDGSGFAGKRSILTWASPHRQSTAERRFADKAARRCMGATARPPPCYPRDARYLPATSTLTAG
jgi:hypothetical protein